MPCLLELDSKLRLMQIFASVHSATAGKMLPDMLVGTIVDDCSFEKTGESCPEPDAPKASHGAEDGPAAEHTTGRSSLEARRARGMSEENAGKGPTQSPRGAIVGSCGELLQGGEHGATEGVATCGEVELTLTAAAPKCQDVASSLVIQGWKNAGNGGRCGDHVQNDNASSSAEPVTVVPASPSSQSRRGNALYSGARGATATSPTSDDAAAKCPFAAALKAAGHDLAALPMPQDGMHGAQSCTDDASARRSMHGFRDALGELETVPETRPIAGELLDEELEGFSPTEHSSTQYRRESQDGMWANGLGAMPGSSKLKLAGSSMLSSSSGGVFKFSLDGGSSRGFHKSRLSPALSLSLLSHTHACMHACHTQTHTRKCISIDIPEPVKKVICVVDHRLESVGIRCKWQRPHPSEEEKAAGLSRKK